jgi:hypothetical protein
VDALHEHGLVGGAAGIGECLAAVTGGLRREHAEQDEPDQAGGQPGAEHPRRAGE